MRNEGTNNHLTKFVGIVQTFEDSLRTFSQAFALFIELTQNVQTRSFLRQRPLNRSKILFRFAEQSFFFPQARLDIDRVASARFA